MSLLCVQFVQTADTFEWTDFASGLYVMFVCKHISKCENTHWCHIAAIEPNKETQIQKRTSLLSFYFPSKRDMMACFLSVLHTLSSCLLLNPNLCSLLFYFHIFLLSILFFSFRLIIKLSSQCFSLIFFPLLFSIYLPFFFVLTTLNTSGAMNDSKRLGSFTGINCCNHLYRFSFMIFTCVYLSNGH